jgi:hypothetical protein
LAVVCGVKRKCSCSAGLTRWCYSAVFGFQAAGRWELEANGAPIE